MNPLDRLDPRELGRRLKTARNNARVTQEQAARHIGVARTTIVAVERGDRRLAAGEFVGLCDLYQVPPGRLLQPDTLHVDLAPQFRRVRQSTPAKEAAGVAQLLQEVAARYVELERLLGKPLEPDYPPTYRLARGNLAEQAEDLALDLRTRLGIGLAPIPDLLSLLETELRIRLFVLPLPSRISGAYAYHSALDACILVNAKHTPERQAWTAAHELGHFVTDRGNADVAQVNDESEATEERFANLLAGALLMPAAAVRKRYKAVLDEHGKFSARSLVFLAAAFHVSVPAMTLRLEAMGLLAHGTHEALRERGLTPAKARELLGEAAPAIARAAYLPRYTFIALEAYDKELISEGELARMLNVGRIKARELIDAVQEIDIEVVETGPIRV